MSTLKNNPKYSAMFAAFTNKTTDELKDAFVLLDIATISTEISLSKACLYEEIESRIGEVEAGKFIDACDLLAA